MNKKWLRFIVAFGVIIFVGGPLFIQYNHWPQGSNGNGDWLSFWGSYLGVIPSGLIAYFVSKYQIESQRNDSQYMEYTAKRIAFHIKIDDTSDEPYILIENMSKYNATFMQVIINAKIDNQDEFKLKYEESTTFRRLLLRGKDSSGNQNDYDSSQWKISLKTSENSQQPIEIYDLNVYYQTELREMIKITYIYIRSSKELIYVDGYNEVIIANTVKKIQDKVDDKDKYRILEYPKFLTYLERKETDSDRHEWVFRNFTYNNFEQKLH